mmetsp:Transcript_17659/g.27765  ORF Transcript_17659/g.27765 Transcript_17659/m.27765 type:complete len:740 (+) Transcript_17659:2196-4415(+)
MSSDHFRSRHRRLLSDTSVHINDDGVRRKRSSSWTAMSNLKYIILGTIVFLLIVTPCICYTILLQRNPSSPFSSASCVHDRHLLLSSNDECYANKADPWWIAIFCFLGALYCFLALSIVCDEFFVPSLEVITLKLDISNDVAGATLMAAGGSAPELATSLIGTFQRSDVGFSTIVGSAVFNVLFVIGICAFASPTPLELTWWPLFRDCTYYAFGLAVLAIFFIGISKKEIIWYEALILLILYCGYVMFMKYNQLFYIRIQRFLQQRKTQIKRSKTANKVQSLKEKLQNDDDPQHRRLSILPPTDAPVVPSPAQRISDREVTQAKRPSLTGATFRVGVMSMLLKEEWDVYDVASITVVNTIVGNVEDTFNQLDTDGNGYLDRDELKALLDTLFKNDTGTVNNQAPNSPADAELMVDDLFKALDIDQDGKINFNEFSIWYLKSEERIMSELQYIFNKVNESQSGFLTLSEFRALLITLEITPVLTAAEITRIFEEYHIHPDNSDDTNNGMSFEQFKAWITTTDFYHEKMSAFTQQANRVQEMEEDDILQCPASWSGRFWFVLTIPLVLLFTYTIPDAKQPRLAKYCYAAFVLSIAHIGFFSYFLVEWTAILGDTLRIPLVVMGLTFLAAGTSIPDLLSSVIVAKQGHGDMAVSSSIGSNIFDILVGLAVPWLLFNIIYGEPVKVNAEGLEVSLIILLCMLVAIVTIIKLNQWRMTKTLGVSMMVLYVMFVAQDLARADWTC